MADIEDFDRLRLNAQLRAAGAVKCCMCGAALLDGLNLGTITFLVPPKLDSGVEATLLMCGRCGFLMPFALLRTKTEAPPP